MVNLTFKDTPTDICQCGTGVESTEHFLLICPINPVLNSKNQDLDSLENVAKVKLLLYGNEHLNFLENKSILNATIEYIRFTERLSQV